MTRRTTGRRRAERGEIKAGLGCLLWVLGVPLPIVLLIMLLQSC